MVRLVRKITLVVFALLSHNALSIAITPSDCNEGVNCWTSSDNNLTQAEGIASLIGVASLEALLYKSEVEGAEEGLFMSNYETVFSNTADDPSDAEISYTGGQSIDCSECYLSVKGGRSDPAIYVFDLAAFNWDGLEAIVLTDFWPRRGAISHVAIWGSSNLVSEPGTVFLFTGGILALILRRRKLAE